MPILTNILQKAGKSPKQNRQQKVRKEAPVGKKKSAGTSTRKESPKKQQTTSQQPAQEQVITKNAHSAYQVIARPHISEKSVQYKNQGKYMFDVFQHATTKSVAQAVKNLYNTDVVRVQIVKVPHKKARMRTKNISGVSTRYNKAIVTIKKGQSIEILPQ